MGALPTVEIGELFQDHDSKLSFLRSSSTSDQYHAYLIWFLIRSRARTNGATTTFRRPSGANNLSQRSESLSATNPTSSIGSVYVPPHLNSNSFSTMPRNGNSGDNRYTKDQLLDMFRAQQERPSQLSVEELFIDGWSPTGTNGLTNGGWSRHDDYKESNGPEICWDHDGGVHPLGLLPLNEEEKEVQSVHFQSITAAHQNRPFQLLSIHPSNLQPRVKMASQIHQVSIEGPQLHNLRTAPTIQRLA